jgi:hypothetical protein
VITQPGEVRGPIAKGSFCPLKKTVSYNKILASKEVHEFGIRGE